MLDRQLIENIRTLIQVARSLCPEDADELREALNAASEQATALLVQHRLET